MTPYFEMIEYDESKISIEKYDDVKNIRLLEENSTIIQHRHRFYELVLICRGTCSHTYHDSTTILIPGDVFLIPPDHDHSYEFYTNIDMYNCQFYQETASAINMADSIHSVTYTDLQRQSEPFYQHITDIHRMWENTDSEIPVSDTFSGDINRQGIIHLSSDELIYIRQILSQMLTEQIQQTTDYIRIKRALLEILFIQLGRIKNKQFNPKVVNSLNSQENIIYEVLNYIEFNIDKNIDFNEIAKKHGLSTGYFRKIFKVVTGLSPTDYLNRVRILRALELLKTTYKSISEISAEVGIDDQNYFSRLFKKLVGCPPKYYKSIR